MGIVRPEGSDVNDVWFLRQVSSAEEQLPTVAACGKLAEAMQTTEMVARVSGAGRRVLEAEERLILEGDDRIEVGEHLVAELRPVHLGAEPSKLVAAGAPARGEIVARHGRSRMVGSKVETGSVINLVYEAGNLETLVQLS